MVAEGTATPEIAGEEIVGTVGVRYHLTKNLDLFGSFSYDNTDDNNADQDSHSPRHRTFSSRPSNFVAFRQRMPSRSASVTGSFAIASSMDGMLPI